MRTAQEAGAPLRIVETVVDVNDARKRRMAEKVIAACGGSVAGKTIAVLGLTFKPNTDDMRESAEPRHRAGAAGGRRHASAPSIPRAWRRRKKLLGDVVWCDDAYEAMTGADALVIVTEWNEFRALDLKRIKALLKAPVIVDLRNIYKPAEMAAAGFQLHQHRPPLSAEADRGGGQRGLARRRAGGRRGRMMKADRTASIRRSCANTISAARRQDAVGGRRARHRPRLRHDGRAARRQDGRGRPRRPGQLAGARAGARRRPRRERADVLRIGLGPTPMLYFAVNALDADGGIMVTGSHNPPDFNGFKIMLGKEAFFGAEIQELGELAAAGDYADGQGQRSRTGRCSTPMSTASSPTIAAAGRSRSPGTPATAPPARRWSS